MPKCFSKCRNVSEDLCINECQYVNGAKKPYCRLSQKYQMDDDCVVRIKAKKTRTKKCVSKCSNKSEELCKDECKYIKVLSIIIVDYPKNTKWMMIVMYNPNVN